MIALHETISQLRDVTCRMGSHCVTCHPTQVNTPRLNPSQRPVHDPGGMEGWVDSLVLCLHRFYNGELFRCRYT